MPEKQVVSRKRVAEHGEVYTASREVNAMLDLVKQETERIDSRFLEPACGTGNFLAEILTRKLRVVHARYRKSQLEYERHVVVAVGSIYGIDILQDNVFACQKRLYENVDAAYTRQFKKKTHEKFRSVIRFILERNILWGNALDLKTVGGEPIVFSEWSAPFHNSLIKRRDFFFSDLLPQEPKRGKQLDLFAKPDEFSDLGEKVFIPTETASYPPIHYLKLDLAHAR